MARPPCARNAAENSKESNDMMAEIDMGIAYNWRDKYHYALTIGWVGIAYGTDLRELEWKMRVDLCLDDDLIKNLLEEYKTKKYNSGSSNRNIKNTT